MGGKRIPDRWRDYTPFGKVIKNTRIFALKVPLKPALSNVLPEKELFTPQNVLEKLENLGLIVDLTNTTRYYSGTEFVGRGVLYQKIKCEGHVVPSLEVVTKFFAIIDSFLNSIKDKLVGIHCTHGLNRTGYLVCRYLIQRLGFEPKDAIEEFNSHRGHRIERQNYIDDLMSAKWEEIKLKIDYDLTKSEFLNPEPDRSTNSKGLKRTHEEDDQRDPRRNKRHHGDDRRIEETLFAQKIQDAWEHRISTCQGKPGLHQKIQDAWEHQVQKNYQVQTDLDGMDQPGNYALAWSSISAVLAGILFVILMVARGGSGHPHKLHSVNSREKLPRLLQNSCTMKYVDLSGEKPTAKGEPNTPEVDLLFGFSDSQAKANLDMYIQSAKTRRYLCFSNKGKQVLQEKFDKGLCEFNEIVSGGSHVSYVNVENPDWVLAYSHNGKDLAVDHIKNRKCSKFVKSVGTQQGQKHEVQAAVDELIANHWPKPLPKEKPKHSKEKDKEFSESTFKHKVVERVVSTGELSEIERFIDDEIKRQTVRRSAKRRENRTNNGEKKVKRKKKDKVSKRSQR